MVNSVIKGYQMIGYLIASMPLPIQALFWLVLACLVVDAFIALIKFFVGG